MSNDKVQMWVFAYQGWGGTRIEGAATKREAKRLRGELLHHPCGPLERIVVGAPMIAREAGGGGGGK